VEYGRKGQRSHNGFAGTSSTGRICPSLWTWVCWGV